jgi:hypothetical protein
MSKIETRTTFSLPAVEATPENETLPTLDRPAVVEYARSLGVPLNERYVRQASQDGTLPSFLIRNRRMFSRASVRAWLASLEENTVA